MAKVNYKYLSGPDIGIEGPSDLLGRIGRNFEEPGLVEGTPVGTVYLEEGEFIEFHRDRTKPYLAVKENKSRGYKGLDFLRYGIVVRTVWKRDTLNYEIRNFLPLDESAALNCFKKIYYSTDHSLDKVLLHGSLVEVGGRGVLITGKCWSGKTSLALAFLERMKARLVSDGNVLISHEGLGLRGHYLPRPVFVRFHSIGSIGGLSEMLRNPCLAEAEQPFDREAIKDILEKGDYSLDAGLNISRKKFAEMMGIETISSQQVDLIVHTEFLDSVVPAVRLIEPAESYELLRVREFPKNTELGNIKHQREIEAPRVSIIAPDWVEAVRSVRVSFDARKNLTLSLLEGIL